MTNNSVRTAIEEQLREDLVTESTKNIFLEAGAGAGKTSLIVKRIVHQIFSGVQKIEEIVVITFTEKAANELEERISKAIDQRLKKISPADEFFKYIEANKHLLFIGTIHSFCQKVIKERPIESEIPITYSMDEEDNEIFEKKRFFNLEVQSLLNEHPKLNEVLDDAGFDLKNFFDLFNAKVNNKILGIDEAVVYEELSVQLIEKELQKSTALLGKGISTQSVEVPLLAVLKTDLYKKFEDGKIKDIDFLTKTKDFLSIFSSTNIVYKAAENAISDKIQPLHEIDFQSYQDKLAELARIGVEYKNKKENLWKFVKGYSDKSALKAPFKFLVELTNFNPEKIMDYEIIGNPEHEIYQVVQDIKKKFESMGEYKVIQNVFSSKILLDLSNILILDYVTFENSKSKPENLIQLMAKIMDTKEFVYSPNILEFITNYSIEAYSPTDWIEEIKASAKFVNQFLQSITTKLSEKYVETRTKLGKLSFNDLLYLTHKILLNKTAREFFHKKYRHLYVDEVQDTDPLQMMIIFALTAESEIDQFDQIQTADNSLFLVGDPKQSIYRFRNADIRVFNQIKQLVSTKNNWLCKQLQFNFRSQKALIEWFNKKFEPMFKSEEDQSIQPNYVDMAYKNDYNLTDGIGVKYFITEGEDFYEKESKKISCWIRNNVENLDIVRKDDKGYSTDKMKFSDVMIILPKTGKMSIYLTTLQEHGIPTSFSGKVSIAVFKEIHRLMAVIRYIAYPTFDHYLVVKAICENHLLSDLKGMKENIYADLKQSKELGKEFESEAYFESLKKLARNMNPISFTEYLIYNEQSLIFDKHISKLQYESSLSILTTFLEKIRTLNFASFQAMSILFDKMIDEDYKLEYEMSVEDNVNAVRIMNLHKTKGLEAPVVILAGEAENRGEKLTNFIERYQFELGKIHYSLFSKSAFNETVYYYPNHLKKFEVEFSKHNLAEDVRLLYVAATRARQLLLIGCKAVNNDILPANWGRLITMEDQLIVLDETLVYPIKNELYELPVIPHLPTINSLKLYDEVSASKLEKLRRKKKNRETTDEDTISTQNPLQYEMEEEIEEAKHNFKGPLWGNIVHELYEMAIKAKLTNADDVALPFYKKAITNGLTQYELSEAELSRFGLEQIELKRAERLKQLFAHTELIDVMRLELQKFLNHDQLKFLIASGTPYTELHFKMKLRKEQGTLFEAFLSQNSFQQDEEDSEELGLANLPETLYTTGYIDLLIECEDKLIIIDYKTNAYNPDITREVFRKQLTTLYTNQLKAYKEIAQKLFDNTNIELYLYAVSTDELIEIR